MIEARVFGVDLALDDDFELPGVNPPSGTPGATPTVVRHDPAAVRDGWAGAGAVRTRELRAPDDNRVMLSVDHDPQRGYLMHAPGTGTALISPDGLDVRCERLPDADDWPGVFAGQVLPLVATVRGVEVFHAAGVTRGGGAYLLCGAQGVGKSSLAAHLVIRGADLLSDDVVALDDRLRAQAGVAVLHLRDRQLQQLAREPVARFTTLEAHLGRVRLAARHPAGETPLKAIYLLERAPAGEAIERLPAPSPFSLLAATFNLSVQTSARLIHQLDLCARLAAGVAVFRVRIVPGRGPAELAQALWAHIEAPPGGGA